VARLYICAIITIATVLFLAVDELEPNRRLAPSSRQAVGLLLIS
jgi:hypothetical protein